jgi:hypothetical protein
MGKKDDEGPSLVVLLALTFKEQYPVVWYRESCYLLDGHCWRKLEDRELRKLVVSVIEAL